MKRQELATYRKEVVGSVSGVVLEIGFGSGANLPFYKNVTKLFALEPSSEMIDIAKKNAVNLSFPIEYIQTSAEKISFPDNYFDYIISTFSLCTVENPQLVMQEIFRVLKPNGIFVFIEHGKSSKKLIFSIQNLLTPISKPFLGGCHMNRDIEQIILSSGFKLKTLNKFTHKLRPLGFMYVGSVIASK